METERSNTKADGPPQSREHVSPTPTAQSLTFRIVCLGDSITRGYGLPAGHAWPALLEAALHESREGAIWSVVNAGVPGDTILQGLARMERDVLIHRPAVVFVAFGLNDAHLARRSTDVLREQALWQEVRRSRWRKAVSQLRMYQIARARLRSLRQRAHPTVPITPGDEAAPRVSLPAFAQALTLLVDRLRQALPGVHVLLVTPTPITERFHPEWTPDMRAHQRQLYHAYVDAVREAAASLRTGLVDAHAAFIEQNLSELVGPDGVHLTAAGQARLADLALHALTATTPAEARIPDQESIRRIR